jgi:hypothetical protein
MQEAEDFDVQPPGDLGRGGIAVGHGRASDSVVGHLGFAARQFLDEKGDRRVGAGRGQAADHPRSLGLALSEPCSLR